MAKRRGSGDGSIYQDKSGRWIASITVESVQGRQTRRKRSARTYGEARTRLKELQDEARLGLVNAGRLKVGPYLDSWYERQVATGRKSAATIANYDWAIQKHLKPGIGGVTLSALTPDDIEQVLNEMADSGAAQNTMMRVRAVLSMALTDAVRRRSLAWNAASVTTTPNGPKRASRAMTLEEATKLLKTANGDRLEAMWIFGVMIGLRPGELCGLTWPDVDLDQEVLHIQRARLHESGGVRLGEPKTPFSERVIDLPARAVEALRRHKVRQAAEKLASTKWADWDLVFPDLDGIPLTRWRLVELLNELTERAGVGHWQPRELRHTAISLMYDAGIEAVVIGDVAGHAPGSKMTSGTYRHAVKPSVSGAKTAMDGIFGVA